VLRGRPLVGLAAQQLFQPPIVQHIMNAISRQKQRVAVRERRFDDVHVCTRAGANDIGQRVAHRVLLQQHGIRARIARKDRRHPRIVRSDLPQAPARHSVQARIANVPADQASADGAHRDNRRPHSRVMVGGHGAFQDLYAGEEDRCPHSVAVRCEIRIEAKRPVRSRQSAVGSRQSAVISWQSCEVVGNGVNGHARGDFAGIVTAHAVGDDSELQIFVDGEAVFVGRPDATLVCDPERA